MADERTPEQYYDLLAADINDIINKSDVEMDEEMEAILRSFHLTLGKALGLTS